MNNPQLTGAIGNDTLSLYGILSDDESAALADEWMRNEPQEDVEEYPPSEATDEWLADETELAMTGLEPGDEGEAEPESESEATEAVEENADPLSDSSEGENTLLAQDEDSSAVPVDADETTEGDVILDEQTDTDVEVSGLEETDENYEAIPGEEFDFLLEKTIVGETSDASEQPNNEEDPSPERNPEYVIPEWVYAVTQAEGVNVGEHILEGGEFNDLLISGGGDTQVFGGAGDDILLSGGGPEILYGGDGRDELSTGGGGVTAYGEEGSDFLIGGGGDILYGGNGNDILWGNGDKLYGGDGDDLYVWSFGSSSNLIAESADSSGGHDVLRLVDVRENEVTLETLANGDWQIIINSPKQEEYGNGRTITIEGGAGIELIRFKDAEWNLLEG
jgi:Ca2+-binding RTX toxin-like protein